MKAARRFCVQIGHGFYTTFYDLLPAYDHFTAYFLTVFYTIKHYHANEKPRYSNLCGLYRGFYVGGVREI